MAYSFVRKLVKDVPQTEASQICRTLMQSGIDVLHKRDEIYEYVSLEELDTKEAAVLLQVLYVSAADLEYAKSLVKELGMEAFLCSEAEVNASMEMSEVEKAEAEFYRKHKQNQLFAGIIIVGVIVFMLFQVFGGK